MSKLICASAIDGAVAWVARAEAKLAEQAITCAPVAGTATYGCRWQAWRIAVAPCGEPRPLEMKITTSFDNSVELKWKAFFIPL